MIKLKTPEEILIMQEGGRKLRTVVKELLSKIKPRVTTKYIDEEAERLILREGGESSFKKVKNYKWSTCLPINEQIVHTPPSERIIKAGDILTLDIGLYFKGYHTDYATTFVVGNETTEENNFFLQVGKNALSKAMDKVKSGTHLGEISKTIQEEIEENGFYVIPDLTGHGIGQDLHEDPFVPGFLDTDVRKTYKMKPGLVIAVEVIYSKGTRKMVFEKDSDWSIKTVDNSLAACFEHTLAITGKNTLILT